MDDEKSPLEIMLERSYRAELVRLENREAELAALTIGSAKPKRRRPDFHNLRVIDGGRSK